MEFVRKKYGKRMAKIRNFYGKAYYRNPADLQPGIFSRDTYILFCI